MMAKKKIDFDFDLGLNLDLDLEIDNEFDFQEKFTELCMRKIQKKKQNKDLDLDKCSKDEKSFDKGFNKTAKDLFDLKPIELGDLLDNQTDKCLKKPIKPEPIKKSECCKEEPVKPEPPKKPECSKKPGNKKHDKDFKQLKKLKHLKDLDKLDDLDDLKHLKKLKHLKSKKDCICKIIKKSEGKRVSICTKSGKEITGTIIKVKKDGCVTLDQSTTVSTPAPPHRTIINCKDIESISKFL